LNEELNVFFPFLISMITAGFDALRFSSSVMVPVTPA